SAPGRIQTTRQKKRIVFHFIQTRTGHHSAGLRFFSKHEQIGQDIEMLAAPRLSSDAHAALHLVENEQEIVVVADLAQLFQPLAAKMIIAALALDRLDDDGADVDLAPLSGVDVS